MTSNPAGLANQAGVYLQPVLVRESSPSEAPALAKRLREAGAKMYGAFWCTHCHDQKEEFGREAMSDFPYVECYPDGVKNVRCLLKILPLCATQFKNASYPHFPGLHHY